MYRNKLKTFHGKSLFARICRLPVVMVSFLFLLAGISPGFAAQTGVYLIMGDYNSKTAIDVVKNIRNRYPEQNRSLHFDIITGKTPNKVGNDLLQNGEPVGSSGVGIINIMDRRLIENLGPRLTEMIRHGVKVYAVGGAYGKEHQQLGLINDETVNRYYRENGLENMTQLVLFLLKRDCGQNVSYREPVMVTQNGLYLKGEHRVVETYDEYRQAYKARPGPWVGIPFFKTNIDTGETQLIDAIIDRLEKHGMNALPVFGYPSELAVERFFLDENGKARVQAVIGLSLKVGLAPQRAIPILTRLGVPVIDAITLSSQSRAEWERSPVGLDIFERSSMVGLPELAGIIQPTVVASKEKTIDKQSGLEYVTIKPIPERVDRLVDRVTAWLNLQQKKNSDKRIALIYYNYPPGKQNIAAAYLNVLPESLYEIVNKLKSEGYDTGAGKLSPDALFGDVHGYGRNIGNWAPAEIDRLARSGKAVMLPVETYKSWFDKLPAGFRKAVVKDWGEPENSGIMTWTNPQGEKCLILPGVRYGNILLTPEPSRGLEQDVKKLYHDVHVAPHHQYIAFHLWLKNEFGADAVAHIGTHGTHEWLGGKEVGFTKEDPPEILIQDLPNIYPYIVDDVGEGLQAKRRGMGVVVDYMTPPFDKAGMNRDLKELAALISDYTSAKEKSPQLATAKLEDINRIVVKSGMLTDLKFTAIRTPEEIEMLDDYIKEISETHTPFGLHTFGRSPEAKYRRSTAEAIISVEKDLTPTEREKRVTDLSAAIEQSGPRELNSFAAALAGKYIPAGRGNDPIRNPDSLPTGKNFYSFDPARVPSSGTYETGAGLARELIEGYKKEHGIYPDKLTFNIWATETIRHEGVMESQIMYLMGVRPKWDERGRVAGIEAIPRDELGRPRIDVTIVPSGLYRDIFSLLMTLLDNAVTVARDQDEEDNLMRTNTLNTKKTLMAKGIAEEKAGRMASVRIFTEPPGAYGTNLDKVIVASNTWENEKEVADVYFLRMSYMFGQGFWGDKEKQGDEDLGDTLLKNALSGSKIAIHSRSTNTIGVLDTDDFFQYLGGTAMAIRAVDGKSPEVFVTNMTNPKKAVQETLEKSMGREMRARYLNPEWIKAMMKEGYAGARFIDKVTEHLWGWQVTVPEAVDAAKWQEMYETYVLDKNGLDMKELFRQSKNMWAYQSVVARMLETVRKEYWKPDKAVVEKLAEEYAKTAQEVGLACCDHTCNNPQLTSFTSATLLSIPGMSSLNQDFVGALDDMKKPDAANPQKTGKAGKNFGEASPQTVAGSAEKAPDASDKTAKSSDVEGFEMKETSKNTSDASSAPIPWLFIIGFVVVVGMVVVGFRRGGFAKFILQLLLFIVLQVGTAFGAPDKGPPEVFTLDDVVVTAEKIQEYVKNHPQGVNIVERKEIVERNLANVEEVLKTMPGVEVYSTPGIGSRISIRGSGRSSGVMVLLNGRPLNSNQYGSQDLNAIPVDSIQSVSVFKPPVPVWLGPGGSDGAINIVTRSEETMKGKEKTGSTVKVGGGSYGFAEGSLSHQMPLSDGNALVSATTTHRDGARTNSDRTDGAMAMNWNRKTADGRGYEVGGRYYRAEFGSPGPLDNLTPNARQDYQKLSVDTKYKQIIGATGTLAATLYGDSISLEDRSQSGATATLDDRKVGLKADTTWSEDAGIQDLRLGISSEWDEFDHTLAGGHHRFRNGINSQYDRRFGDFTPTIGLRGDFTDDFGFNPGLVTGVGWGISKECLVKVKAGYTVNVPTFEQLYQTTHGSIDQSRGNPDLNEERVWAYDLGVEYTFAKDRLLQMTIFRADTSDLITSRRGADLIYRPTNLDSAVRQGVEITGKYAWEIGLTSETSFTFQDSENKDTGKELPYTPAIKVKETLSYTLSEQKTRLEGTIRYEGSRYSQMENLPAEKIDDYAVVGIKVTQPFMMGGIATDGYLKVDNLFNAAYESHLGYPADGIVATAGLQMKF